MSTLTISVTDQDIGQGECGSTVLCPIALAADRAFRSKYAPERVAVSVGGSMIDVWIGDALFDMPSFSVAMPEDAKDFIAAFDSKDEEDESERPRRWPTPAPFEFMVVLP